MATWSGRRSARWLSRSAMLAMSSPVRGRRRIGNAGHTRSTGSDIHRNRGPNRSGLACERHTSRAYNPAMAKARDRIGADVIADALEARRGELISAGVEEIKDRRGTYRLADTALIEDVTEHIGAHHDLLCAV